MVLQLNYKTEAIPTNTPRVFHVETTWKRSFHVMSTWNTRGVFVGMLVCGYYLYFIKGIAIEK